MLLGLLAVDINSRKRIKNCFNYYYLDCEINFIIIDNGTLHAANSVQLSTAMISETNGTSFSWFYTAVCNCLSAISCDSTLYVIMQQPTTNSTFNCRTVQRQHEAINVEDIMVR